MEKESKKTIVNKLMEKGVLISPDILEYLHDDSLDLNRFIEKIREKVVVINEDIGDELSKVSASARTAVTGGNEPPVSVIQEEKLKNIHDIQNREKDENKESRNLPHKQLPAYEVLFNYNVKQSKKEPADFVRYFNDRYRKIQSILKQRTELGAISSIRRIKEKKDREQTSVIGIVSDISYTKNGNIMIDLEDPTGVTKAIVTKSKPDAMESARNVVNDEVIGVLGTPNSDVIYVDNVIFPDVPLLSDDKRSSEEEYAVFIGDSHIGSKHFLKDDFEKMISWISGKHGNEKQRKIAEKIRYIFFTGDLVDGVGIYPNQQDDLEVIDIYDQYKIFTDYILKIPDDKMIFIIPGNHDSVRISEPQPPIPKEFIPDLYERENISLLSSPSYVRVGQNKDFSGFTVLLYHGYSLPFLSEAIPEAREKGGLERTDIILKHLMQKRHLSPPHTSNLYIPGQIDPLIISPVPDIVATGHVHRTTVSSYRSILLINSSCWIGETDYQKKVGLKPQPSRIILFGLHDKKTKIMNFGK